MAVYKVELRVLNDDYSGFTDLLSSHGLSIHLRIYSDSGYEDILFDVGPSSYILNYNSRRLGIDLGGIKAVVLSHRHYDHTGGLKYLIKVFKELRSKPTVIAHPWIFKPSIVLSTNKQDFSKGLPYSEAFLKDKTNLILVKSSLRVANSTYYLGEVNRYVDVSKYRGDFYTVLDDGDVVADDLPDDTGLAIKIEGLGLIVITGCSHSGLSNIVKHASELLNENVYAVVGGFHMVKYEEDDVKEVVNMLKELNVTNVYSGHCTGLVAEKVLIDVFKEGFSKIHTGFKTVFKA